MKKTNIVTALESGKFCGIVEFRGATAARSQGRDEKTGRAWNTVKATYRLELGNETLEIKQVLPETTDPEKWVPALRKGQAAFATLALTAGDKGVWFVRLETIEPLEN